MSHRVLQEEFSDQVFNARGIGSLIAFDCSSPEARDNIVSRLCNKGECRLAFKLVYWCEAPFCFKLNTAIALKKYSRLFKLFIFTPFFRHFDQRLRKADAEIEASRHLGTQPR